MSGLSALQPYRFCVRTARPSGAVLTTYSLLRSRRSGLLLGAGGRAASRGGVALGDGDDGGQRVLSPALAEAGEEGENEQGQVAMVRALALGDGQLQQAAAEGERDRHREHSSDQRA